MEWIYVTLIVGALIYMVGIVFECTSYALEVRPRISRFEQRTSDVCVQVAQEKSAQGDTKDRIGEARKGMDELRQELDVLKGQKRAEQVRKQRLEMVVLKSRLKGKRAGSRHGK